MSTSRMNNRMFQWDRLILLCIFCLVLAISAQAMPAPAGPQPVDGEGLVPLDDFLASFLRENGLETTKLGDEALPLLLDRCYLVARVGLFDLWFPRYELACTGKADRFEDGAVSLLDMQEEWLRWTADEKLTKEMVSDFKVLRKWIQSWKLKKLFQRKNGAEGRPDLLDILKADDKEREACLRIADLMTQKRYLGWESDDKARACSIIFSPDRKDFLGLGTFIASLNATNRMVLWKDGLAMWTSFNRGDIHVIALEHPSTYPGKGDITRGMDMNDREKTGLKQHVVQHGMELMLAEIYEMKLQPDLAAGLSMNMVIELFKENNVRAGGGSGGTSTEAFSRFVAGGNSSGGRLAARNADNRWRHDKGKGYFVDLLRESQKDGSKAALKEMGSKRDKRAFFVLEPDDGVGGIHLVEAPFLTTSKANPVPSSYQDDYLEFLRAYRSAFAHWLMEEGKSLSRGEDPPDLLKSLLTLRGMPDFREAVCTVYGCDLSAENGQGESLEWDFLDWLARS